MKKLCIFLCCVLMLHMLAACGTKAEDFKVPVRYYFSNKEIAYNTQNGVIQAEIREGADLHGNLTAYLHSYLRGPISSNFIRIIPSDVYLVSCNVNDETAEIVFSNQFSKLTGVELVSACSAYSLPLHHLSISSLMLSNRFAPQPRRRFLWYKGNRPPSNRSTLDSCTHMGLLPNVLM